MRFRYVQVFSAIAVVFVAVPSLAISLWVSSPVGMFADQKARGVGDLVTVLIVEETQSSQKASTEFQKDLKHSNKAGTGPFLHMVPEIGFTSGQSSQATGSTTLSNNLVAKITATVKAVQPNGDMRIEGKREVTTNNEKQIVTLTATVRPQDIGPGNTVASTFLADVQIQYSGKGQIANRQKEGIISRLLRWIF